jgi:hypothetical protein
MIQRSVIVATVIALASVARAQAIEPSQTRPKRPLVLYDGQTDLHAGIAFGVVGDPELDIANTIRLPIGADFGVSDSLELGAQLDLTMRPELASALSGRARLALGPGRMFAVGIGTTLPLGYLSGRLGPEGLPLVFELPAFRAESVHAAVQAAARWHYHIVNDAPDPKLLDLGVAGILRIGKSGYVVLEGGTGLPDYHQVSDLEVRLGLGLGYMVFESVTIKLHAGTPDATVMERGEILLYVVNTSGSERKPSSDWL